MAGAENGTRLPMRHISVVRIMVCAWLCLPWFFGMAGCSREAPAPLQVATNVWPGYEPLYLARSLGYYPDSAVRFHEMTTSADVLKAFRNHAVDVAALTLDEALLLVRDGIDVRILLVADISHGADAIMARPAIKTIRDLKGKRVGVESMALGAYVLTRALDQAGLSPRDVTVVPVPVQEHEHAYRAGEIDAVVTFEPARTRLVALGAHNIFDSRQIPNEIIDVVVVRADMLQSRPGQVKTLEEGWFKALEYLRANPADAARLMGKREGLTAARFKATLDGIVIPDRNENKRLLSGALLPPAKRLADVMLRGKLLDRPVDPARLVVRRP
ncbi:PhnD/SsuA/transferrin family substrate-binding protein [Oryzomonas japonica]|uniref:PhnD/SsuA/transferrin family substrate-binding protein n=2 Tax=Oryzomonas japonica TaxID=2603858 RepID=A0A7J4ZMV8_9BACT|nr:PhnD/SsuA/transferrin family substrate-binding protein [Oryzomonas japonica]